MIDTFVDPLGHVLWFVIAAFQYCDPQLTLSYTFSLKYLFYSIYTVLFTCLAKYISTKRQPKQPCWRQEVR